MEVRSNLEIRKTRLVYGLILRRSIWKNQRCILGLWPELLKWQINRRKTGVGIYFYYKQKKKQVAYLPLANIYLFMECKILVP